MKNLNFVKTSIIVLAMFLTNAIFITATFAQTNASKCVSGNCVNGKGKMVYTNGDIYEGDFVRGKKQGKGTLTYEDGGVYIGQFSNNFRHGKGEMTFPDDFVYAGNWVNDKQTGKGKETYSDGSSYEGDFVNDKFEGQGTHTYENGDYYIGKWKDGMFHGYGKFYNKATNITQEGTWGSGMLANLPNTTTDKNCVSGNCVNGKGKKVYPNGDIYEGDFANGLADGDGKASYAVGDIYKGRFYNGKREGSGTYTYKNGNVYIGQLENNMFNKLGKFTFSDGNNYEGYFVNDKYQGYGTLTFKDGAVYDGQFSNNARNGKGKNTYSNGEIYDGNWVNDKREGQGTLTLPNGSYYIGEWKNDNYNGYAKYYDKATNPVQEGTWKDGVLANSATANAGQQTTSQDTQPKSGSVMENAIQDHKAQRVAEGHTILGSGVYTNIGQKIEFYLESGYTYEFFAIKEGNSFSATIVSFAQYTDRILKPTHSWDGDFGVESYSDYGMMEKSGTLNNNSFLNVSLGITYKSRIRTISFLLNRDSNTPIHWIFIKAKK